MKNVVFFNGKFIEEEKALLPVNVHALHYGTACFEGIRAYYNKAEDALFIFRMKDHFLRMQNSTKVISIKLPHSVEKLCDITRELVSKNFAREDIYIRPLAYKADRAVGNFNLRKVGDGFFIYTVPLGRHYKGGGLEVMTSSWVRVSKRAIPPSAKITGSYVNTCLAKTESATLGFDEALFLDDLGNYVEGSAQNLFVVKDGILITPPTTDPILEGVTRNTVILLAKDILKLKVAQKSISKKELFGADEVFLTGTGSEIAPVVEVDGKRIAGGKVGKVTNAIQSTYDKLVHGKLPKYKNFLTKVSL